MADHLTRKELKQDNVALRVEESIHFAAAHKRQFIRFGVGALALVVIVAAGVYYRNYEHTARQQQLADAITLQNAAVGSSSPAGGPTFPTEAAKKDAVVKAYTKLMTEHSGSDEAYIAEYSLGAMDVEAAKMADARRKYQDVADHADKNYSSLAKLALAQIDFAENKSSEAQSILKDLAAHPTDLVSEDQANIAMAKGIMATQPEEARKLLLAIASRGTESSQIAVAAMSDIPAKK